MSYMSTDRISNHRLTTVIKATTDVKQNKTVTCQVKNMLILMPLRSYYCHVVKGGILRCHRACFGRQKGIFYNAKEGLLHER